MAKSLIIEGLKDAVRHSRGDNSRAALRTVHVNHPLDVKSIRTRLNLTQKAFASRFGFSLAAVQNWEQGRRHPKGVNKNLLKLIDRIPDQVQAVLAA